MQNASLVVKMNSEDFGKITHILMNSNIDAIKMLKILYKVQKLNTDLDWDSSEEPKIVFSEEETTKITASAFETHHQEKAGFFPRKKIGEF